MTIIIAVTFNSAAIYRHWQPNRRGFIIIRSGIIACVRASERDLSARMRYGGTDPVRVSGPHIYKIEMPVLRRHASFPPRGARD